MARIRSNDPAGTRRKIVDAAFDAFTRNGYNATAMHDIRDAAGVSSGAFAHHFPSKKSLGLAVIDDRVRDAVVDAWIEPVVSAASTSSGVAHAFDAIIADLEGKTCISGCPLNNLALELSVQDVDLRQAVAGIFSDWAGAIRRKLSEELGETSSSDNAQRLALFVVAAYSGAMAMAKASQDVMPLRQCRDQIVAMLAETTGARP